MQSAGSAAHTFIPTLSKDIPMKISYCKTKFATLAAILLMLGGVTGYAETLGDVLRESKWDGIIGTWVDSETKGQNKKVTYAWKVKDHAILVTGTAFGTNSVALMGRNAKDGTLFHVGTDNKGTSVLGKWELKEGEVTLALGFVSGEGAEGTMLIRYTMKNEKTLIVSIEGLTPEPIVHSMVKVQPIKKAPKDRPKKK